MRQFTVFLELRLNTILKLFAIRSMSGAPRPEDDRRTYGASGFHGDVAEPFRNANGRLFHLRFALFDRPVKAHM